MKSKGNGEWAHTQDAQGKKFVFNMRTGEMISYSAWAEKYENQSKNLDESKGKKP